jgi:Fe2+ or Zn2+ uptake regulation protein
MRLESRGWRITPQRRAIAAVLVGENVHLAAETIYERARVLLPELSVATVYNTLNELVAMREVREVQSGSGPKRYDPNVEVAHHHLVCTNCGCLHDLALCGDIPSMAPERPYGFTVTGIDLTFHGLCSDCQQESTAPQTP